MSLLAEELVEEWLNRNGFFTIRGVKLGVQEIDLLAVGLSGGQLTKRHIEVNASLRPISYLTALPKNIQKATGRGPANAKRRSNEELKAGVAEWVEKKYNHPRKRGLLRSLAPGEWTRELVVHEVRYPEELDLLRSQDIVIHRLSDIVRETAECSSLIPSASGSDLFELVQLADHLPSR